MRSTRSVRTVLVLVLALATDLSAQSDRASVRAGVDSLLSTVRVADILMHLGGAVQGQVEQMAPMLSDGQQRAAREAVARHFSVESLLEGVAANIAEEAERGTVQELLGALTSGRVAEARRMADAYQPTLSLEEFMTRMSERPLPESRVALVSRLARAQGVGHFYVMLAETTRGAAHTVLGAVVEDLPRFRGIAEDEVMAALDASYTQAIVSFLYRFEGVSDELLTTVAESYESAAGQWYVGAYARAVGDAVLDAAERAREELGGR